jgi:hypothetical protein
MENPDLIQSTSESDYSFNPKPEYSRPRAPRPVFEMDRGISSRYELPGYKSEFQKLTPEELCCLIEIFQKSKDKKLDPDNRSKTTKEKLEEAHGTTQISVPGGNNR